MIKNVKEYFSVKKLVYYGTQQPIIPKFPSSWIHTNF